MGPRQGEAGALGQSYDRVAPVPLPTAGGIGAALAGGGGADFPGTSRGVGVCEGSASPEAQDTAVPRGASPPASFLARPDSRVGGGWLLSVAGGEDFPITTSLGAARSGVFMSLSKQDSNRDLNSEYEGALPRAGDEEDCREVNGKSRLPQAGALGMVPVDYAGRSPQTWSFSFTSRCRLLPNPILNPFPPECHPSCPRGGRFC